METVKKDWLNIHKIMIQYNRKFGYVSEQNKKLTFFDSNPKINNINALFVSIDQVENIIKTF